MMGVETATFLGLPARSASFRWMASTAFGSACCGSGMRFALPSFTGTTEALLTVADHSSVPAGRVTLKCALPRLFTKYCASVRTWPSFEMRVESVARSATWLSESPCTSGLSASFKLNGRAV